MGGAFISRLKPYVLVGSISEAYYSSARIFFLYNGHQVADQELRISAYSVEKLENFLNGKIIFDITNFIN